MDADFSTYDILKIAESVEQRELDFYSHAYLLFDDPALCETCLDLAYWSSRHKHLWVSQRHALENQVAASATFHATGLPDAGAMAGLTWFGQRPNCASKLHGVTDRMTLLKTAAKHGRDLIVFYQGLKAFALDQAAMDMIDAIAAEEWRHLEYVERLANHDHAHTTSHAIAVA